jgi:hypothetical protein
VRLVGVLGNYLLYRKLSATLDVPAQPNQTETSSAEQLYLFKTEGETVSKCLLFLFSQAVALVGEDVADLFLLLLDGLYSPLVFFLGRSDSPFWLILLDFDGMVSLFFDPFILLMSFFVISETDLILVNQKWFFGD